MAEVEEYLNSGDYEMSDNKYPYIGDNMDGQITLIYSDGGCYHIKGDFKGEYVKEYNEVGVKNITREYLANTCGKCESQEHADFICNLAENAGFNVYAFHSTDKWFYFDEDSLHFVVFKSDTNDCDEEPINLPLPKKQKQMEESKPVYTKEMHERGELPPVGSKCIHSGLINDFENRCGWEEGQLVDILSEYKGGVIFRRENLDAYGLVVDHTCNASHFKPIPTIEDELSNEIANYITQPKAIDCSELADLLSNKFNITPKGE